MKTRAIEKESNTMSKEEAKKAPKINTNDGYGKVHQVDPVGYWNEEDGAVYFTPTSYKVFDGNIEKAKPAVLIMGTLTQASPLYTGGEKNDDYEPFMGKEGDFIAVWGKPGMGALKDKSGTAVKMWQEGEKDTKKPNPMKLYKVATKGGYTPKELALSEDTRNKSFGVKCFLETRASQPNHGPQGFRPKSDTNGDADDDIQF